MFDRRRQRCEFVLKSCITGGGDFRSSLPTVRFGIDVFYYGGDLRSSSPTVRVCIEILYYGERFSLVVPDGTISH